MKNLFLVFVVVILVLALVVSASADAPVADEVEQTTETTSVTTEETEDVVTEQEPVTTEEAPVIEPTEEEITQPTTEEDNELLKQLLARLIEAWENGELSLVISLAFDVAIIIFAYLAKRASKKSTMDIANIFSEEGSYSIKQNKTIKAINDLIASANEATAAVAGEKAIVEKFQEKVEQEIDAIKQLDKEKLAEYGVQLESCMASVKLMAEMLQIVYSNSSTISMPVKNMISEKYVDICQAMKTNGGGEVDG